MQPASNRSWHIAERISPEADHALQDYPPFIRQILYNRGIATRQDAAGFLENTSDENWDPFQMLGMEEAVSRIERAISQREWIVVYGDYDVDGVSATALLVDVLTCMGAEASEYIPNRFDEGYGLNIEAIESLHARGARLVITVDCGIRSITEADRAAELGLDLIITDHHHCGAVLPRGIAVINPRQPGDPYPEKELAGVGLAYKLAQALLDRHPVDGIRADNWIDLVALGTVADLAPLVGENRVLTRKGIRRMRIGFNQGLLSLAGAADLKMARLNATDIGFVLGPRLNAAGRLESAITAYQLLLEKDVNKTAPLAQKLDNQNRERQKQTREIQQKVEEMVLSLPDEAPLIFAADESFNQGLVGLAASRIADHFYRPTIVAHRNGEYTRGSCRSIPGFHITGALDQCSDLLIRHGGHAAAAGFTVANENVAELVQRLTRIAALELGDVSQLIKTYEADMEISLPELNFAMFDWLDMVQPCGYGNAEPMFVSRNLDVREKRIIGKEKQHLKLKVMDGRTLIGAIAFRMGDRDISIHQKVDLLYTFERNEYNGMSEPQLNIKDIRPSAE